MAFKKSRRAGGWKPGIANWKIEEALIITKAKTGNPEQMM